MSKTVEIRTEQPLEKYGFVIRVTRSVLRKDFIIFINLNLVFLVFFLRGFFAFTGSVSLMISSGSWALAAGFFAADFFAAVMGRDLNNGHVRRDRLELVTLCSHARLQERAQGTIYRDNRLPVFLLQTDRNH